MMATGTMATYDLTAGVKLDMEDLIYLISPTDVPLQTGFGADGSSAIASGPCFEKKVEWLDEELLLPKSTAAATATSTEGVLTVASGHQARFSTGDELLMQSGERLRVTGYGTTADTLLVTRGFASSTTATIATSDTILIVGNILAEGSDPQNARALDRNARYNMTQILGPTQIAVSGSENVVQKYGLTVREFDKQVGNRTKEQFIIVEQAIMRGTRIEDSSNKWRAMGGLSYYISTNIDSTTTVITETKLLDQIQACFDAGGNPDRAVVGSKQKRTISGFNTNITVYATRMDGGRGQSVSYFESDFGTVTIMLNRWCPKQNLFLFNRDQVELATLRPLQFEMLAKTGDSMKGQVVGEKTMKFRVESHAAMFTALT